MTSIHRSLLWLTFPGCLQVAANQIHDRALSRHFLNKTVSTSTLTSDTSIWRQFAPLSLEPSSTSTSLLLSRTRPPAVSTGYGGPGGAVSDLPPPDPAPTSSVTTDAAIHLTVTPSLPLPPATAPRNASVTAPGFTYNGTSTPRMPYGNTTSMTMPVISSNLSTSTTTDGCVTLAPGQAVTSWIILPNTDTITVTILGNLSTSFSTTPEFTPPIYCSTTIPPAGTALTIPAFTATTPIKTSAGESSYTLSVAAPTARPTTTVITTSKNPVTVYTTRSIPQYGDHSDKASGTSSTYVDTYIWGPLPDPGQQTTYIDTYIWGPLPDPGQQTMTDSNPPQGTQPGGLLSTPPASPLTSHQGSSPTARPGAPPASISKAPYTTIVNGDGSSPGPVTKTVGSVIVVVSSSQVVIGTKTISVGSSSATVTEAGATFTINPSQVIGPSVIVNVPSPSASRFVPAPTATTVQGISIDINPSTAVIGGTSYSIGGNAPLKTVIAEGQTISLGSGGIFFSATSIAPPVAQQTNVIIVNGEVFSAVGSNTAIIGGMTFTYAPSLPAQTDTFNGELITIGPQGISFDGTTLGGIALATGTQLGIAGGISITEVGSTLAIVAGTTFTVGPNAPKTTAIVNRQTITAGPSGISIGGATLVAPFNQPTQIVTAGGLPVTEIGSTIAVVGGHTFTFRPDSPTTSLTINGAVITAGPSGLSIAGSTLAAPFNPSTQIVTAGGFPVTEIGSTIAIIGGHTLTLGSNAPKTTFVVNGKTIFAGPSGVTVAGTTLTAPFNQPTQALTAGGITFTEIGSTLAVIGTKTYTFGPGASTTTATINGQTISIGPGGIGFKTTTFTAAASGSPTHISSSATKNMAARSTCDSYLRSMCGALIGLVAIVL